MSNKQLKQRIQAVWKTLKGLKAAQIEHHIGLNREVAQTIAGVGQIQKIRNSSLLKLLLYQLIVFCDQKCHSQSKHFPHQSHQRQQDTQGTDAMIQQLQLLLKKKQARIRQLNNQLQQNFNDKEQLQMEIQALEDRNVELEENIKKLQDQFNKIQDDFQQYKVQQKQELLFGASQFMNNTFPHKRTESTVTQEENKISGQMLNSTQLLSRYCKQKSDKFLDQTQTNVKQSNKAEIKTVKKALFKQIEEEDENLLESIRIYKKKPGLTLEQLEDTTLENEGKTLQRILLMQASFIENVMEKIIN